MRGAKLGKSLLEISKTPGAMSSTLKCLRVLDVLANAPYQFTLTELSEVLGLGKSTVHRFVTTLMAAGYVEQELLGKRYRIAKKALWIGSSYLRHSAIYRCGFSLLEELSRKTEAMSHLAVLDGESVLYLHTSGPPRSLNLFADSGERRPVHATALGKAMMACQPDSYVRQVFSRKCERYTPNTIVDFERMEEELQKVRRLGYAIDDEEGVLGLRCIAVAIRDGNEAAVAAISVSGSREKVTDEAIPRLAYLVKEAALRISVQLGYRPATSNLDSLLGEYRAPLAGSADSGA